MTENTLVIGDYELRVGDALKLIEEGRFRKVLLQLPEGLKRYYPDIANYLQAAGDLEVHLDAGPIYGSCLLDSGAERGYDIVIHIGHDPYPLTRGLDLRVVFLDLEYVGVSSEVISADVEKYLRAIGASKVAVATTNQHKKLSRRLQEELEAKGIEVDVGPVVLFGCYLPPDLRVAEVDAILVVAGGFFHAIGVGLSIRKARIVRVDPYTRTVCEVSKEISRFLSVRLKKMSDALGAAAWGILVGSSGQYRPMVVSRLKRLLKEGGYRYFVYVAPVLDIEVLRNIDSPGTGAYVVTSCPRIAVDDLADFEKPVLTPAEALAVLEKREVKEYPEGFL